MIDKNIERDAKDEVWSMMYNLFGSKALRRTVPRWSLPLELWRMLLFPGELVGNVRRGLGAYVGEPCISMLLTLLVHMHALILLHACAPLRWLCSDPFFIDKKKQQNWDSWIAAD